MDRQEIETPVELDDERRRLDKLLAYFREQLEVTPDNPDPESDDAIERQQLIKRIESLESRRQQSASRNTAVSAAVDDRDGSSVSEDSGVAPAKIPIQPEIETLKEKDPCRFVLVDDQEAVRRGVKAMLEPYVGFNVVGEASDGDSALQVVKDLQPDILIMDLQHPGPNGLAVTRWVTQNVPGVRVVILTMFATKQLIRETLQSGARGYVMKSYAVRDLVNAVNTVLEGKLFFPQTISEILRDGFLEKPRSIGNESLLTKLEIDIVSLLSRGKSNKDVAAELKISLRAIETHRANIMNRLQLHSVQDLARYAVNNKLVEL